MNQCVIHETTDLFPFTSDLHVIPAITLERIKDRRTQRIPHSSCLAVELDKTGADRQSDIVIPFSGQPVITHTELDLSASLRPPDICRKDIIIGRRIA